MSQKDVERTDERGHGPEPWWAGFGGWGAVLLIVVGVTGAAWVFLRLPGTPDELWTGYHQAAKVVAIGMVIAGTTLMGRRRARAEGAEGAEQAEQAEGSAAVEEADHPGRT
ncbi:hypothetical protein ACIREK_02125 [Streptomyces sp. NPDC102415]|uniref:hypothetical protein n=1 Tax=Streptomyces sp. NPDC102415 TaxID=3366173 RepID=UPI00382013FA